MAKVKYGSEIKTKADLQNLITGLIFRKEDSFTLGDMVNLVAKYSKGTKLILTEKELTSMVEYTLDLFQREDLVSCENGRYTGKIKFTTYYVGHPPKEFAVPNYLFGPYYNEKGAFNDSNHIDTIKPGTLLGVTMTDSEGNIIYSSEDSKKTEDIEKSEEQEDTLIR